LIFINILLLSFDEEVIIIRSINTRMVEFVHFKDKVPKKNLKFQFLNCRCSEPLHGIETRRVDLNG